MRIKNIEISVIKGDITESKTQAIVNAANNHFQMGGGVAAVIKRKGGAIIEEEAQRLGPVKVGEVVLTTGGKLKAQYVIHAATMALDFKTNEEIIRQATYSALLCAQENKISSIAFCALGCGTGGFEYFAAAKIMAQEVFRYSNIESPTLKEIVFVLYSRDAYEAFQKSVGIYLEHMIKKVSSGPYLTVDGIVTYQGGIVMIERSNPPFGWALPGGFVDYAESVEDSVVREVKEETNLDFLNYEQFKVYSKPHRDPRFHTVSVVFIGEGKGRLAAATDAKDVKVFKLNFLPKKIAFDHRQIITDYIKTIDYRPSTIE